MTPTTRRTRAAREQRERAARARKLAVEPTKPAAFRAGVIPWLAVGATLWAAVPPLLPGLGVPITWMSLLFGVAVGIVAIYVGRTAASPLQPGDAAASVKTAVVLVLLVVVPVVFDPRTLDGFNLAKLTAVVIGALALVAAWAIQAVTSGSSPRWRNGLHWPVLALLVWTAITTATSSSPRFSVLGATHTNEGLLAACVLAIVFFAVVQAFTIHQVKAVLAVMYFGGGGLTVLYGLVQLHDRLVPGGRWDWIRGISGRGTQSFADGRIFSTFGNPNHLGGFLAVLVPIGVVLFLLEKSRRVRILVAVLMVAVLLELIQTASRGAMAAAVVALAVAGALLWPEVRRHRKVSLPVVTAATAAVAALAIGLAAVPQFSDKLSSGLDPGATLTLRLDIWEVGLAMANDQPLVGHGPDTWVDRAPRYRDPETAARYGGQGYYANGAHNLFVGQLAATGYPGAILLVTVLLFATLRGIGAWRRLRQVESQDAGDDRRPANEVRLCLVAVVAGLAASAVQASFNLSQIGLSFLFWVLLGLLCVVSLGTGVPSSLSARTLVKRPLAPVLLGADVAAEGAVPLRRGGERRSDGGGDIATGALTVVICLCLGLALTAATRPLRADHNAAAWAFARASAHGAPPDEASRLSRQATARLSNAVQLNPWEASYLARHGDGAFGAALSLPVGSPSQATALTRARRDYQRAVELRPDNVGFLRRYADILLKIHEVDPRDRQARVEAVEALRRAVIADPYSTELRERLQRTLAG